MPMHAKRPNALTKPLSLAIAMTVASIVTPAFAQDFALEEIVVTAQKRAQSLQDVPMSVSAVGEEAMRHAGIQTVADVKKLIQSM